MENYVDYYKALQVHQDADQSMIDAAYRCLSKQYHPDLNKGAGAAEKMISINAAYDIVGNSIKRRAYHREWLKHNMGKSATTAMAGMSYRVELAQTILDDFFRDMVTESWMSAYIKLTDADRASVPEDDFVEWKTWVSKLYKLANFVITFEKRHVNCEYGGIVYPEIMQFSLALTVMDISTGEMSKELTRKYVAFNNVSWKLCLGYTDLKPIIMKFKRMKQSKGKITPGQSYAIYPFYDMVEQAQREVMRSQRYGNPLCLLMISVRPNPGETIISYESYVQKCLEHVAAVLAKALRKTDLIGRYRENTFAVFLTETKQKEGREAMKKAVKELEKPAKGLNYKIYYTLTGCNGRRNAEEILETAFEKTTPDDIKRELVYFL